jgi:riboflavin synthase
MFTGLIESVGEVLEMQPVPAGFRLRLRCSFASELAAGESIAVNGVCLTAVRSEADEFRAEIGPQTARVTTLGGLQPGSLVNLERAMRGDARFGGHFVLGHVDAVGTVERIRPEADFYWFTFGFPPSLAPYVIDRGSIAVDGISLTIASLDHASFDVQIVPHTWSHTNLQRLRGGDAVNLETDMVGKYVVRAVEQMGKLTV